MATTSLLFALERVFMAKTLGSVRFDLGYLFRQELRRKRVPLSAIPNGAFLHINFLLDRRTLEVHRRKEGGAAVESSAVIGSESTFDFTADSQNCPARRLEAALYWRNIAIKPTIV